MAIKIPRVRELHGDRFVDDYFWMRERANPEVIRYLEAENDHTAAVMAPLASLQEALYTEMLARIKETDLSVPALDGGYYYYSRTEEGRQYAIHCRRKGSLEAAEEIILDVNELATGEPFMSVGAMVVSDDGALLAYSTDNSGFRDYQLFVKDLRTGRVLESPARKVTSAAWAADGRTFFYTIPDDAKRSYRLYRHTMGGADPALVYEERDERFSVHVSRARSRQVLFLESASLTSSEVRYLLADRPDGDWQLIAARQDDHEYDVEHRGDRFYIRTNQDGRNFSLMTAPVSQPDRPNWKPLVAHRVDVMLEGVLVFKEHLVLWERERGLPGIRVTRFGTPEWHSIAFSEAAYTAQPAGNPEFETTTLRYAYQSFVTPPSVFDFDMDTGQSVLLKEYEVLGGYDRSRYRVERIHATAADGIRIPISLVSLRTQTRDGRAPIDLSGYGSYGLSSNVTFSSSRFSLVDRGVVYAVAHIRGGGDLGKTWHDEGRMLKKKNTFTDFIAAAEHLIAEGFGAQDRLVIEGGSAGGLLMGAVVNMRPDLFKAVVSQVPFVDVISSMSDTTLPLTVAEFEEWGNPARLEDYEYMKSYDPYVNLERKAYPAMLVKTSFHDSQVMYWEPAKYVARLRALKTDDHPLLFKVNMAAGHGGASGRYDRLREIAFDYAFMLWQMRLVEHDGAARRVS